MEKQTEAATEAQARCWQYDEDNERIFARHVFELQQAEPGSDAQCIHCAKPADTTTQDASLAWRQPLGILRHEANSWLLIRRGFFQAIQSIPSNSELLRDHKHYTQLVKALYLGLESAAPVTGDLKVARVFAGTLLDLNALKKTLNTDANDILLYTTSFRGELVDNQNEAAKIKMRKVHFKAMTGYLIETPFIDLFFTRRAMAASFLQHLGWLINFEGRWLSKERGPENAFLKLLEKEEAKIKRLGNWLKKANEI